MNPRTILGLVVAAALGATGYAVARELSERAVGTGATSGGGMMGDGMAGMMDGCREMMQGGGMASGQPNARWKDSTRNAPSPDAEKRR